MLDMTEDPEPLVATVSQIDLGTTGVIASPSLVQISVCQKITQITGSTENMPPIVAQPRSSIADQSGSQISLQGKSKVHPGLYKLKYMDHITVHQQCSTCCRASKYRVKDNKDNLMFNVREESSFCMLCCCYPFRSFKMRVVDTQETEVMRLRRPVSFGQCYCCCGNHCLPMCLSEMEVCSPPSDVIGRVRQKFSCCSPFFTGVDDNGKPMLSVTGSCCRFACSDVNFKVRAADKTWDKIENKTRDKKKDNAWDKKEDKVWGYSTPKGDIIKKWTNCGRECCTNAHLYKINFAPETTVEERVMMLGAAILIDFLHYT